MIHQDRQILEPKTTRPESVHGSGKGGNASGDNDSTTVPLNDPCDECRLILRFKHPGTMYEKFVSTVISSPVHVDIVLDKIGTPHKRVCFSAYMNEKFSMTLMPQEMIQDKLYENFSLRISNRDFVKCSKYLQKMMDKVPYNYSDAMVLMPSIPSMGETIANTMVQDIERGTDPEKISSVFCSQVKHPHFPVHIINFDN